MKYDIMNFEALGEENAHLGEEFERAKKAGLLPPDFNYFITPLTLQEYIKENPQTELPELITTKTHSVLPQDYLNGSHKSIITRSAGYDHFEHLADKANITSLRKYCVNAVAQTAIKLLYCTAGYLNQYEQNTLTFERNRATSFTELEACRTATVFGVGKIGKRIYELCKANGLTVQAVDIRESELSAAYGDSVKFVSKEQAIKNSDIIINAMNLTRNSKSRFFNAGYFSEEYLSLAEKPLIFINVTRGEIAPEHILLKLYESGKIYGIGTDVFSDEEGFSAALRTNGDFDTADKAAAKEMLERSIARSANIYVQPHQAFNSDIAATEKAKETIKHVIAWYKNGKQNFDEQLPYYVG